MAFDFHQQLADEDGEIDEELAGRYVEELAGLFAESPEGVALGERGIEPGSHLEMFLDYALRYTGVSPAEMDAGDVREALDVFAQKVTGKPKDLDLLIPELEAFCDFAQRAFGSARAATWKREIQSQAGSFRRSVRDPRHWGMAKSMMMKGVARGYDLSTEAGINQWMLTLQAEQLAGLEGRKPGQGILGSVVGRIRRVLGMRAPGPAPSEGEAEEPPGAWAPGGKPGGPLHLGPAAGSRSSKSKEKTRRKQAQASRRRNRR